MNALDALADPVRRRLCEYLRDGDATAGTLAERARDEFGISQPATSRHLRLLREADVVTVRSESTSRWYALHRTPLAEAAAWLGQLTESPTQALDALDTEIARGKRARRHTASTESHEETA